MMIPMMIATGALLQFEYFFALFGLVALALFLNDRIFHRRSGKKKVSAATKLFEERLKKPDFESLEKHFSHSFPQGVKGLYGNQQEILQENFKVVASQNDRREKAWSIAFYQPADLKHIGEAWPDTKEVFEFANDGCGNGYTIDPRLDDPPVMFFDHETGEWETVADSFSEFMAMTRR
jgi:hypothetical protein